MLVKKYFYIIISMLVVGVFQVQAKRHYTYSSRPNHFVTMALGGGYSSTMTTQNGVEASSEMDALPTVTNLPGGSAIFNLGYEMRYHRFILGLSVGIDYTLSRQSVSHFLQERVGYIDNVPSIESSWDYNGNYQEVNVGNAEISYIYDYFDYSESQKTFHGTAHLYAGSNIGSWCYALAGVKFLTPMSTLGMKQSYWCQSLFNLNTSKKYTDTYDQMAQYSDDTEHRYSQLPDTLFNPNGIKAPYQFRISPTLEFGVRLHVPSRTGRVGMRLGVYAEWGIPVKLNTNSLPLIDYTTKLETAQNTTNATYYDQPVSGYSVPDKERLKKELMINSVLNSNLIAHKNSFDLTQFTFGVKWTILFNVTAPRHYCVICDDND